MQTYEAPSSEWVTGPSRITKLSHLQGGNAVCASNIDRISPHLVDVSYICDECGRATKRTLKENFDSFS